MAKRTQQTALTGAQLEKLFAFRDGALIDQATLDDIQSVLARKPQSIKTVSRRNFIQTLVRLIDKSGKEDIRKAIRAGDQVQISQVITERLAVALRSGATPGVSEKVRAPRIEALERQSKNLAVLIEDIDTPLQDADQLRTQIQDLGNRAGDVPEARVRSATLVDRLDARIQGEQAATELALVEARVDSPAVRKSVLDTVAGTAQRITSEVNPKQFQAILNEQEIKGFLQEQAPERNLRFLVEERGKVLPQGRLERPPELRRGLARLPLLGEAGVGQAQTSIDRTLKLLEKGGSLETAKTQATGALSKAARGPGRTLAKGGGLLAALLLLPQLGKLLTGGGEAAQPQLPPLLQAQLLQLLGNIQNQEALTQSLVGSRGAQAQKNLAQADLLRLQALTQQGGLVPQVV